MYGSDWGRLRMWALALGLAIVGVFGFAALGLVDLAASIYAAREWNPIASIAGGLLFGYGMALAGNCGYGALARFGGGDLRSFVILLVMGISAYMAVGGPVGWLRQLLFPVVPIDHPAAAGFAHDLGRISGLPPLVPAALIGGLFVAWALASPAFRRSGSSVFWASAVAVAIVGGWAATSWLAAVSFEPVRVESHAFSAPLGETILYAMTASGGGLSFGIGSVLGVVVGAAIGSISRGHFHWEACDDPRELGRQILGAWMMGTGAVIAVGCSVGQGLTAFATLTYSAPVVLAAIGVGAFVGLRHLVEGFGLRPGPQPSE